MIEQADGATSEHTENDGAGENGGLLVGSLSARPPMVGPLEEIRVLVMEYKRLRAVVQSEVAARVRELGVGNPQLMQAQVPSWPHFQAAQDAMETAVLALVPDV